jgi:hypothetical protein
MSMSMSKFQASFIDMPTWALKELRRDYAVDVHRGQRVTAGIAAEGMERVDIVPIVTMLCRI